ncbi:hypothetical protein [Planococcus beigongshangi]|uniref:hypothetical protein n=1 Tax=Planococcus beigongshangi TaxID=2782536 RepID=UPI00193B708F|nr:hypothetical protein [Planococcus beigongshangi]
MEKRVALSILLIVITFIVCLVLNFPNALMGDPPTVKNAGITFIYAAIWTFVYAVVIWVKDQAAMKFFGMFWLLTLFFSVLTILVNVQVLDAFWATPFVALFITPWYGIELFTGDFLITASIISFLSLLFLFAAFSSLRKARSI